MDIRYLFGEEQKFLLYLRPAVPLRVASTTNAELLLVAGAGVRFRVF
jgi:hypothetical protein